MKWVVSKYKPYERHTITKFAWLPMRINGETRWLEKVHIRCYYWVGLLSGKIYWEYLEFVDEEE